MLEAQSEVGIDKDSVKLIKNTKGYNWEIKLHAEDIQTRMRELKCLNDEMRNYVADLED